MLSEVLSVTDVCTCTHIHTFTQTYIHTVVLWKSTHPLLLTQFPALGHQNLLKWVSILEPAWSTACAMPMHKWIRCYEAEIEEKASSRRESNPGHLRLEPPVLCHWDMTTRGPLTPANLCITVFLSHNIQFHLFPPWGKMLWVCLCIFRSETLCSTSPKFTMGHLCEYRWN